MYLSAISTTGRIFVCARQPQHYISRLGFQTRLKTTLVGEFNAQCELYRTMPDFASKPYSWGEFDRSEPKTYFFHLNSYILTTGHQNHINSARSLPGYTTKVHPQRKCSAFASRPARGILCRMSHGRVAGPHSTPGYLGMPEIKMSQLMGSGRISISSPKVLYTTLFLD